MLTEEQALQILKKEVWFHTSRSGGKGGQNVNKVETKVEIEFNIAASKVLSEEQKDILLKKYADFVDEHVIHITASKHRSQLENKEEAKNKLLKLLEKLLRPAKKRVATKPSKASREKKLKDKKYNSEKKQLRQKF